MQTIPNMHSIQNTKDSKFYERVSSIMNTSKQGLAEELLTVMDQYYKYRITVNKEKDQLLKQCHDLQKENAKLKDQIAKMAI